MIFRYGEYFVGQNVFLIWRLKRSQLGGFSPGRLGDFVSADRSPFSSLRLLVCVCLSLFNFVYVYSTFCITKVTESCGVTFEQRTNSVKSTFLIER
ncbi:hypothetical protein [Sporosarcina phage Lietuvens]|nr:hypothetical protein [Sporosarcina phage Lietuvens]